MSKTISLIFGVLILISGVLCSNSQEIIEAIVAIVNDDIITLSQYRERYEGEYSELRARLEGDEFQREWDRAKESLLNRMIEERLLIQEAKRLDIDVTPNVKAYIENFKKENGIKSDEELKRAMYSQGVDFEKWKNNLEMIFTVNGLLQQEIGNELVLDESDIINYYKNNPDEFTELPSYRLRAIYVSELDRSDEEVEARKKEIEDKLKAGADMAELASQYSEGPEKESKGDLGTYKKGELSEPLEEAVEDIKEGELSRWIKVRDGWYILRMEEKKGSRVKDFKEVRKEIEQKLYMEKEMKARKKYIENLKEDSYIKILIPKPIES